MWHYNNREINKRPVTESELSCRRCSFKSTGRTGIEQLTKLITHMTGTCGYSASTVWERLQVQER